MRKIIIPAAGKAERFNGILKEFAPINSIHQTAIARTIAVAVGDIKATDIVIITNPIKHDIHRDYLKAKIIPEYPDIRFYLVEQRGNKDLLSAIGTGLTTGPSNIPGGLLLPDTIVDIDPVDEIKPGITFGVFKTETPERFSIIKDKQLLTKSTELPPAVYDAWGIVLWSSVVDSIMTKTYQAYDHYDTLFDTMMYITGYHTFPIHTYYDIGSIEHYMRYMDETL